jgi:small redox-active disulfide protein 2
MKREILILGTGCPKCRKLAELTEQASSQLGYECEITKVTDIKEIVGYGVMLTPALVVDGVIKCSGSVPSVDQIAEFLRLPAM